MVGGPDGDHQFLCLGHGGQGRRRGPGIQAGRVRALDVVEVEFGDQRQVEPDLLGADGQPLGVVPGRRHVLVFHVPQPAAEDGHPVAVAHPLIS